MGRAIALRTDYDADALRQLARQSSDARQTRRLLALSVIYDGGSRGDAAKVGGVGRQIIRDWVVRFNDLGPDGLFSGKSTGAPAKLKQKHREALVLKVEQGPIPAVDGVVRWRLKDLAQWVWEEYGISVDEDTVGKALRAMGYKKLSARPRHYGQNQEAMKAFKKTSQMT